MRIRVRSQSTRLYPIWRIIDVTDEHNDTHCNLFASRYESPALIEGTACRTIYLIPYFIFL